MSSTLQDSSACDPLNAHPFDRAIALNAIAPNATGGSDFRAIATPDYWNLVGPFGGMTAAMMLNSTLVAANRLGDPVALTVNFAAPMALAEYQVKTAIARTNRTTQHWTIELQQEAQTIATASAVFALRRQSWHHQEVTMAADVPGVESLQPLDRAAPMPWFKQYDLRPIRTLGSTREPQVSTHAWIRDEPARALDFASLTAICDTVMPWMFRRRKQMIPVSTVSLSVYFHVSGTELAAVGAQHVYTRSYGQICHSGFMDSNAQVWSREGVLLATTQQMMWVKE
jgi:acyl-CoA thioesterase